MSLRNEFAMVELGVEVTATGVRLTVRDAESGAAIALDPLELEALTRLTHRDFDLLILQ